MPRQHPLALLFAIVLLAFRPAAAGETILHVLTWADYFNPGLITEFEEEFDCKVEFNHYDSNETLLSLLVDESGGGYDIVTPSSDVAVTLHDMGRLRKIDHALLPNIGNIDPDSSATDHDLAMSFSVPYTVTVTGIGYDSIAVSPADLAGGWGFFKSSPAGKNLAMLNDMREVLGAALKHNGHSLNSTDAAEIAQAADTVVEWKKNIAIFDVDNAKYGLRDGKYPAIQGYNGDIALLARDNPAIRFLIPGEGAALNADNFVIPGDCANVGLAHAFINYFLDPEVAVGNMEYLWYLMPNTAAKALLPEEMKKNRAFFIPREEAANCEPVENLGPAQQLYEKAWERILLGGK